MLRAIRTLHTVVWAFFAGAVIAVPIAAWQREFRWMLVFAAIVLVEVAILALNHMRCPLTDIAARYTDDRSPNFDIYLPPLLAHYNKEIFGSLFVAGLLLGLVRWFA
ncbi:MAG: hypothetical protein KAY59_12230 [Acidobacteria bacterium]|nr:hypothetical protein [Acidobacteriota bacterium]